ncbi:MAG: hypothetical protein II411_00300, partial [Lachnospiraceae bacterium]|nr:hypothetical protein [Lachnospiraceae bacterium]
AAETGKAQMEKANAVIQEALANPNREATKVSETSVKAEDARWTQTADGKWSLSTNNAEPIKDTWQKVEAANGKEGWYKFDKDGNMQTGWVADGNHVYYLIESGENAGQMVRGATVNIGGVEFKFTAEGALESMQDKGTTNTGAAAATAQTQAQTQFNAQAQAQAQFNAQAQTQGLFDANMAAFAALQALPLPDMTAAQGIALPDMTAAQGISLPNTAAAQALPLPDMTTSQALPNVAALPSFSMAFNGMALALPAPTATSNASLPVEIPGANNFNSGMPIVPILP